MFRVRPNPATASVIETLWWHRRDAAAPGECMLPTGTAQIVVALHDEPYAWTAPDGSRGTWRSAVLHGPQSGWYRTGPKAPGIVVGASLRPAAAGALFGIAADALAERHVALDLVWDDVEPLRQRLAGAPGAAGAVAELERSIAGRLRRPLAVHPSTAAALASAWDVERPFRLRTFARDCGFSEKHVIARFRASVGLTPARYFRIRRFEAALHALAAGGRRSLADVAADNGYADHAHLARDFRDLAGIAPSSYDPPDARSVHHHRLE